MNNMFNTVFDNAVVNIGDKVVFLDKNKIFRYGKIIKITNALISIEYLDYKDWTEWIDENDIHHPVGIFEKKVKKFPFKYSTSYNNIIKFDWKGYTDEFIIEDENGNRKTYNSHLDKEN